MAKRGLELRLGLPMRRNRRDPFRLGARNAGGSRDPWSESLRPGNMRGMRSRAIAPLASVLVAVSLLVTACASGPQEESVSREAAGVGLGIPMLPTKPPENVIDLYNQVYDATGFLQGILSCGTKLGCFGEEPDDGTLLALREISVELEGIRADVAAGIATTRLDLAEASYAQAEQAYKRRFGTSVATAYRALTVMSDPASSDAERRRASKTFLLEAPAIMPGTAETAMQEFLGMVGGTGETLTQAGLLGATWKLIAAQVRQQQGDANGSLPVYMPASAINLMANMGTQRMIESVQLATLLTAYTIARYPKDYEGNTAAQDELRREITSLWMNGDGGTPGAASITASLPRTVPAQSGVFYGLGKDSNAGLLVRNFGPVVDAIQRPGPMVNADAGYALTPALDDWLWVTRFRKDPRRELSLSRSGVQWTYDQATGSLTTTITTTPIPSLADETGSLVAVHPATLAAGEIVRFARSGSVSSDTSAWVFDERSSRISPKGRSDLCMALSERVSRFRFDGQLPREWTKNTNAQGWQFGYDKVGFVYDRTPSVTGSALVGFPRIMLKPCAPDSMQQWYLDGPIPQDGLPFWDVNALMPLSPTNTEAVEKDVYPLNLWRVLKNQDVKDIFSVIAARGLGDAAIFEQYGSARTPPIDRALPPAAHPLMWATAKEPFSFDVPSDNGVGQTSYPVLGVAFPVVDGANSGFSVRPVRVSSADASRLFVEKSRVPWLSTAAVLGLDVDPCTFTFVAPARSTFACEYKNRIKDELAVPEVPLTTGSRLRAPARPIPSEEANPSSPTPSPSNTVSPSPTDPSPSPTDPESPDPSPTDPSPSPTDPESPNPSPTDNEGDASPDPSPITRR